MTMIIVFPLDRVQEQIGLHGARRVASLLGPDTPHRAFNGIAPRDHLKQTFHDIVEPMPGFVAPSREAVEELVAFIGGWHRTRPLLFHCWAGISRSTAAAYTALCMERPDVDEVDLAWQLREASPSATPNRLVIALADSILGREGRMVHAIDGIGRGENAFSGTPFLLAV
jgi:predicted protein tyrosine phosphatase